MTPDQMQAGSPEFEQALAELATLLQSAQQQQQPRQMTNDQMAANIERQSSRFPPNMQVAPPFGTDVLGRKQVQARSRDMSTTELITNALGDPKWTNALHNAAPVIDAGPQIAKDTYDQTITQPANAITDAIEDPSLANITNAGVRTALGLSPFKAGPMLKTAATVGGLGLTAAAGTDAFNALAKSPVEAADNDPIAKMDARLREINNAFATKKSLANPKLDLGNPERRTLEDEARTINATKAAIALKASTTGIESEAATKRDTELRQNKARDVFNTSMQDYEDSRKPGQALQTINKLGPIAPAVAAMIGGGITRLARPEASKTAQYVAGVLPAFTVANAKPAEAYMNEPIENPEVTAYKKAGRVLADTDPLKAQFKNELNSLSPTNPLREAAASDLTDWRKQAVRVPIAALEGTGAFLGNDLVAGLARMRKAPADIARTIGELPGALQEGRNIGMQRANAVNQPTAPLTGPAIDTEVERRLDQIKDASGRIRGPGGLFMDHDTARHMIRQVLQGQTPQAPQAPMPPPSTNALRDIATRAGIAGLGVGAGYGLTKLFGQ